MCVCDAFPLGWSPKRDPTNTKIYQLSHIPTIFFFIYPKIFTALLYWISIDQMRGNVSGTIESVVIVILNFVIVIVIAIESCYCYFGFLSNERQSEWVLRKPCCYFEPFYCYCYHHCYWMLFLLLLFWISIKLETVWVGA